MINNNLQNEISNTMIKKSNKETGTKSIESSGNKNLVSNLSFN